MADRRFGTGMRDSDPPTQPGLVMDDSNEVYLVKPDGTRTKLSELSTGAGPSVLATRTGGLDNIDVHDVGAHSIAWKALADNPYDFNALVALPDGLGLEFAFDGSDPAILTTEAGIWSFAFQAEVPVDATWAARISFGYGARGSEQTAENGDTNVNIGCTTVANLPAAAQLAVVVQTSVAATADPLDMGAMILEIVRLA